MNVWDWKYRIFFDDEIKVKLNNWQSNLSEEEKAVYDDIADFYGSFYSFGLLFDMMLESPDKTEEYLTKALNNQNLIIKTPDVLERYYRRKIKKKIEIKNHQEKLFFLLELSLHADDILPRYQSFLKTLFGDSFESILSSVYSQDDPNNLHQLPSQKKIHGECRELFDSIYAALTKDDFLLNRFGKSAIGDFRTQIYDGNGYGEWWDKDISESGEDELVLYTNDNKVKYDDYRYTIIHEAYPGHGHFYNSVRKQNACFDQGAMELVEGWATYCEWNTYPSKYVEVIRHNALVLLHRSFNENINSIANEVVERNRKKRVPVRKYISSLIYRTQYIGYIESYYLGALWIEQYIAKNDISPYDFLRFLSSNNKGEFFRLWQ